MATNFVDWVSVTFGRWRRRAVRSSACGSLLDNGRAAGLAFGFDLHLVFTTRCYAFAVLATGLCPSVSVCHKWVFYRNGWTNRAGFWRVSFLPPVLHCVTRKFCYLQNKGTSFWNFVLKSGLRKFRHGISIVETCYQLGSRKVDAQSVINRAVVGQLSR